MKDQKLINELFSALSKLKTEEELSLFLRDLCTPQELQAMADRWLVAQKVAEGGTYREISAQTGASTATVTRVARALSLGEGGYRLLLNKLHRRHSFAKDLEILD